jgi:hypothetical protein
VTMLRTFRPVWHNQAQPNRPCIPAPVRPPAAPNRSPKHFAPLLPPARTRTASSHPRRWRTRRSHGGPSPNACDTCTPTIQDSITTTAAVAGEEEGVAAAEAIAEVVSSCRRRKSTGRRNGRSRIGVGARCRPMDTTIPCRIARRKMSRAGDWRDGLEAPQEGRRSGSRRCPSHRFKASRTS